MVGASRGPSDRATPSDVEALQGDATALLARVPVPPHQGEVLSDSEAEGGASGTVIEAPPSPGRSVAVSCLWAPQRGRKPSPSIS